MSLKIAITGAGPAGCTLARLLLTLPTPTPTPLAITIFESEPAPNFRSQGGTLDLHTATGIAALRACGLYDEFAKRARFDGEAFKVADKDLKLYLNLAGTTEATNRGRPEIDRTQLRKMLLDSLPEGMIQWGRKVASVEPESGTVKFADGSAEAGFDLIVGADGAWSKVGLVLTDVRPEYSGISGLSFSLWDAETQHKELWELVSKGSLFAWTNGRAMTCQQLDDGSLNICAWLVSSEDWAKNPGFYSGDVESVKREVGKWYEGWNPGLQRFVSEMKEDANPVPRALYNLPIGHTWTHKRGVTLIGDAAHVMTPFAGEGVNAAMADALSLSKRILAALKPSEGSWVDSLDTAVLEYEKEMFARVSRIAAITRGNLEDMFLMPNSPRSRVEAYIVRNVGREMNIVLRSLVAIVAYTYFGIWKLFY